jgi:hypothetical protein
VDNPLIGKSLGEVLREAAAECKLEEETKRQAKAVATAKRRPVMIVMLLFGIVTVPFIIYPIISTMPETPVKNEAPVPGFADGYGAGRLDLATGLGEMTVDQRFDKASSLSSDEDYQAGWRSGYADGYESGKRLP